MLKGWCLGWDIFTGRLSDYELELDASRENTFNIPGVNVAMLVLYFVWVRILSI
jgi:hypothetical protein